MASRCDTEVVFRVEFKKFALKVFSVLQYFVTYVLTYRYKFCLNTQQNINILFWLLSNLRREKWSIFFLILILVSSKNNASFLQYWDLATNR